MRLVTYEGISGPSIGAVVGPNVVDLNMLATSAIPGWRTISDLVDLLAMEGWWDLANGLVTAASGLTDGRTTAGGVRTPLASVVLASPVVRPSKVIGVGMNHRSFVEGIGDDPPCEPVLFHKTSSALTGPTGRVRVPPVTEQAVPEGEVAVIIGREAVSVAHNDAQRHIAGLACANDISARDLEFRTSQWTSGKMLPTFCPLGPALVTLDECPDLGSLSIVTRLNGNVVQCGSTADLLFDIADLVSRISELVRLEPGDVILTGTPSDLGAIDPPVFLRHDDQISVAVDGVGTIENRVEVASRTPATVDSSIRRATSR